MHSIPVLYYHSVGDHPYARPLSFVTLPLEIFTAQIEWLVKKKYTFLTVQQLNKYMGGGKRLPDKSIVLTFDDGYLDNYTTVWPLAKKYDFKFTLYINTDFVDKRAGLRATTEDVEDGKISQNQLKWWGYLRWAEIRAMEKSGLVDVQSHAATHTRYPISDEVVDFHHPGDRHYWLCWNKYPEKKPHWLNQCEENEIPFGTPVYKNAKSLVARKCDIQGPHIRIMQQYVADHGGIEFFKKRDWRSKLFCKCNNICERVFVKRESHDENHQRLCHELAGSKRVIEENLGKKVEFLSWPGGKTNPSLRRLAMELGYLSTTRGLGFNGPGSDRTAIKRAEVLHKNLFLGLQKIYISARIAQLRESKFRFPLNVKKTINRTGLQCLK
jgi:peptidoglycan/xylan/chitin deacetylase (PgdA/CDA1 family)